MRFPAYAGIARADRSWAGIFWFDYLDKALAGYARVGNCRVDVYYRLFERMKQRVTKS